MNKCFMEIYEANTDNLSAMKLDMTWRYTIQNDSNLPTNLVWYITLNSVKI